MSVLVVLLVWLSELMVVAVVEEAVPVVTLLVPVRVLAVVVKDVSLAVVAVVPVTVMLLDSLLVLSLVVELGVVAVAVLRTLRCGCCGRRGYASVTNGNIFVRVPFALLSSQLLLFVSTLLCR